MRVIGIDPGAHIGIACVAKNRHTKNKWAITYLTEVRRGPYPKSGMERYRMKPKFVRALHKVFTEDLFSDAGKPVVVVENVMPYTSLGAAQVHNLFTSKVIGVIIGLCRGAGLNVIEVEKPVINKTVHGIGTATKKEVYKSVCKKFGFNEMRPNKCNTHKRDAIVAACYYILKENLYTKPTTKQVTTPAQNNVVKE